MYGVDEAGQRGHNPPGNQDASNPDASSDFVQQQIAGDFKIPKTNPYCWLVMASSLFIVNAANPMLMRSRKPTM